MSAIKTKRKKPKVSPQMSALSRKVGMAIGDYDMLQDGDKVIVGVSGGKDSFTLLELLLYRQTFAPIHFDLMAVHVDFGILGEKVERLKDYFEKRQIKYLIKKVDLLKGKTWEDIDCFWCSWNRRKVFFQIAQRFGFNKLALGHHLDDIAETILLNLFFHGNTSAMVPKQELFNGKLTIIRPLAYIQEKETVHFIKRRKDLQYSACQCPNSDVSKRRVMKKLIKKLEKQVPCIRENIVRSIKRIKEEYLP
ncbi:MAG: ATP-binding protein [Candidatus Omnitrophota bacterium]